MTVASGEIVSWDGLSSMVPKCSMPCRKAVVLFVFQCLGKKRQIFWTINTEFWKTLSSKDCSIYVLNRKFKNFENILLSVTQGDMLILKSWCYNVIIVGECKFFINEHFVFWKMYLWPSLLHTCNCWICTSCQELDFLCICGLNSNGVWQYDRNQNFIEAVGKMSNNWPIWWLTQSLTANTGS